MLKWSELVSSMHGGPFRLVSFGSSHNGRWRVVDIVPDHVVSCKPDIPADSKYEAATVFIKLLHIAGEPFTNGRHT